MSAPEFAGISSRAPRRRTGKRRPFRNWCEEGEAEMEEGEVRTRSRGDREGRQLAMRSRESAFE